MTDEDLLRRLQDCERRCEGGRQSAMRNAADMLHRETAGHGDSHVRQLLHRVLCSLSDGSMRELDDAIRRVGQYLDRRAGQSMMSPRMQERERQFEKQRRFAENYGADQKTLHMLQAQSMHIDMVKAHEVMQDLMLKPLIQKVYKTMTSIELQVQLDAAIKAEAIAAEAKAKADDIQYHVSLAAATTALLGSIQSPKSPVRGDLLALFRKELAPLARHFGWKIVLVGDRTAALLVQA